MRNTALTLSIVAAACATLPALTNAATCSTYQRDRAEYYAKSAGEHIVSEKYIGGSNIRTNVRSCDFNSYSNKYTLDVEIYWNGMAFSRNTVYNSDGRLEMDESGSGIRYNETYRNQALKSFALKAGIVGGVVLIGTLAAANSSSSSSGSSSSSSSSARSLASTGSAGEQIYVKNNCSEAVELWVHYKKASSGRWTVWYHNNYPAGRGSYLADGSRIRAIGNYIEYATDPIKNATDDTFSYNGRSLKATTLYGVGSDGDRNIYLCGR